jgi:GNAT superfamily N-acetyltransferase
MEIALTVHDAPPGDDARVVDEGLGAANAAAAPVHDVRPLACFARGPGGKVVGGALGRTWGACCELQQIWVCPDCRHGGLGTRLVRAFESAAAARGCVTFYLETFSFQAVPFYRKLGYDATHEIRGFAPGIVKYTMMRSTHRP